MKVAKSRGTMILVAIASVALASCKPDPTSGSVDLVGDSISVQAAAAGAGLDNQPQDLELAVDLGWEVSDVLDWVHDQVGDGRPETLIVALGTNDASPARGGWTWEDISLWVELLDAPHPDACVVVVLPALGDGASSAHADQVDNARDSIVTIAGQREAQGATVIKDWATVIGADPSVLAADGIHLAPDPDGPHGISVEAAQARLRQYWQGTEEC